MIRRPQTRYPASQSTRLRAATPVIPEAGSRKTPEHDTLGNAELGNAELGKRRTGEALTGRREHPSLRRPSAEYDNERIGVRFPDHGNVLHPFAYAVGLLPNKTAFAPHHPR